MKKNLQRFGASVLAAAMVAQSVALPAAAETTKIEFFGSAVCCS